MGEDGPVVEEEEEEIGHSKTQAGVMVEASRHDIMVTAEARMRDRRQRIPEAVGQKFSSREEEA